MEVEIAWRPHGHARVDPENPRAFAVCDRCGRLFNAIDLVFQHDFRGPHLQNLWIKVCKQDLDAHAQFLRPVILPADPVPIMNPRPEDFDAEMNDDRPTPPPTGLALGNS